MGYTTAYSLQYSKPADPNWLISVTERAEIEEKLFSYTGCHWDSWNVPGGDSEVYCRWYDWDKDMAALSLEYPDILFTLYGDGEDSDDLWCAYFLNGKKQIAAAEIVYPPFDPVKLE